jgi:hypothetical protein
MLKHLTLSLHANTDLLSSITVGSALFRTSDGGLPRTDSNGQTTSRWMYFSRRSHLSSSPWPAFGVLYFGPLVHGGAKVPVLIHLHAVVFVLWLGMFVIQIVLGDTKRVRLHVQLGRWVMIQHRSVDISLAGDR